MLLSSMRFQTLEEPSFSFAHEPNAIRAVLSFSGRVVNVQASFASPFMS